MGSSSDSTKPHPRRPRKAKSICLAFESETQYQSCVADPQVYRPYLLDQYQDHPELFPPGFEAGFVFHDCVTSRKQGLRMRRVKVKSTAEVYQIRPSFMMPYMIGRTAVVEKPLFLRRWGVPFEALTYVFGHSPMYWYRAYVGLGRPSIVGTTLKATPQLPAHVLADEKHSWRGGCRVYIPTTVGHGCILGAEVVATAGEADLKAGYSVFRDEARQLQAEYTPETVNTDGWTPTQNAWTALFPGITLLLCFLHAVRKITTRCRRDKVLLRQLQDKVWHLYHAPTLATFAQRLRRIREWVTPQQIAPPVKDKVLELCAQAPAFKRAYPHPEAYRTSNALDRLMNYQDRLLYAMQYFHGTPASATLYVRAMALLWNFHPYDRRTQAKSGRQASPFERANGFRYHENWLENLLIAASLNGRRE